MHKDLHDLLEMPERNLVPASKKLEAVTRNARPAGTTQRFAENRRCARILVERSGRSARTAAAEVA